MYGSVSFVHNEGAKGNKANVYHSLMHVNYH